MVTEVGTERGCPGRESLERVSGVLGVPWTHVYQNPANCAPNICGFVVCKLRLPAENFRNTCMSPSSKRVQLTALESLSPRGPLPAHPGHLGLCLLWAHCLGAPNLSPWPNAHITKAERLQFWAHGSAWPLCQKLGIALPAALQMLRVLCAGPAGLLINLCFPNWVRGKDGAFRSCDLNSISTGKPGNSKDSLWPPWDHFPCRLSLN